MTIETILISLGIGLGVLILFLIGFVFLKTALFSPPQKKAAARTFASVDGNSVAKRLGLAVQYRTISDPDPQKIDHEAFFGLQRLFRTLYPQVHMRLTVETINDLSLLYTWVGKNPELQPIMLISHLDVVPADESEGSSWTYPPFNGEIADGYVWGRGTLDIKNGVIGIFEAVEHLLKQDFQPERTVYLGFGHDEEIGGQTGAKAIAQTLSERGISVGMLLDEGGNVIEGLLPDLDAPVGAVGISEKGYLSLRLSVAADGGHSSMPPQETAIGILSRAIANLEANPLPAHLEVIEFLMGYLGTALPFSQRLLFANTWLFGGLLKKRLAKSNFLNAMIRTTTAPTISKAGEKDNVLPARAEAVVNFRLLPGDDLKGVYEMVRDRIGDPRVEIKPFEGETLEGDSGWDPSPVADIESPYFSQISELIKAAFPDALVSPFLVLGGTDARHYAPITDNAFRFTPVQVSQEDLHRRVHGVDERLSIENCAKMVAFYIALIEDFAGGGVLVELPAEEGLQSEMVDEGEDELPILPPEYDDEM